VTSTSELGAVRRQRPLVSIHGINTNGAWQKDLRPVFSPHFKYVPISYPHYRFFGATSVLIELWIIVPVAVLLVLAMMAGMRPSIPTLVIGGAAAFFLAYLAASLRRRLAFVAVLRQFDNAGVVGQKAFVVAHSFGTYLCGRLLQRRTTRCSSIVFAGSVLSREFPTRRLTQQSEMTFQEIRNETGLSDWVVKSAGMVRQLVPDLGDAGLRGFTPDGIHIHDLDAPDEMCDACKASGEHPKWLIHNVKIQNYAHSDQFITPQHALRFWLPALWGIDAPEFRDWLELCQVASQAGYGGIPGKAAPAAENVLLARRWSWADDVTIHDFILREFPSIRVHLRDPLIALRIYRAIWNAVARACDDAVAHEENPDRMAHAQSLDPRIAVRVAVGVVEP
jgi:pimeloyl-ACP methyl ester carboxylesterase